MKRFLLLLLLCFIPFGSISSATARGKFSPARNQTRDKIKATKTIKGYFTGFEMGDYMHAVIKKTDGQVASFFLGRNKSVPYFLVAHKNQMLELTYQVVASYIPEAGRVETIERIVAVKSGDVTDAAWWKKERAGASLQKLRKKYDPIVDQASLTH